MLYYINTPRPWLAFINNSITEIPHMREVSFDASAAARQYGAAFLEPLGTGFRHYSDARDNYYR
jgi:hypothetical protein